MREPPWFGLLLGLHYRMRGLILLLLLIVSVLWHQNTFAGPVLGLEENVTDTTLISIDTRLNNILSLHPLLNEQMQDVVFAEPRMAENKTTVFLLSLLLLFMFSLVRNIFPRYFANLFQLFTGFSSSKRHITDQLQNDNRASLWFYILFYVSAGFIVYQFVVGMSGIRFYPQWYINYLICVGFVLLLLSFRTGMIRLTGWIFKRSDYVEMYLFNTKLVNEFLGVVLFPLGILILISSGKIQHSLMILAGILCLLLFLYGYVRNIPVLRNLFRISFVHFLLYLCAFEVLPVLILIKMIR